MAWTISNPCVIGAATKKSNYDTLWDNIDCFKIEHNIDGSHIDIFNVKSPAYGAIGNGVVDDSSVIQGALTAAVTAGGGIIYFPPGIYLCNAAGLLLSYAGDISSYISLIGCGHASILKTENPIDLLTISTTGSNGENVRRITIDKLGFYTSTHSATLLKLRRAAYNQFTNLDFTGGTAIDLGTGTNGDVANQFNNIRVSHVKNGLLVNGSQNQFANFMMAEGLESGGNYQLYAQGAYNQFSNFEINAGDVTTGATADSPVYFEAASDTLIANMVIHDSDRWGMNIYNSLKLNIKGLNIYRPAKHGLYLNNVQNSLIQTAISEPSYGNTNIYSAVKVLNQLKNNVILLSISTDTDALYDIDLNGVTRGGNTIICGTLPKGINGTPEPTDFIISDGIASH